MEVNETLSKMTGKFIFTGAIIFILMVGSLFLWVAILGC
jgi:heme/copper-type cytochrome/quinol oxidase subunit 4